MDGVQKNYSSGQGATGPWPYVLSFGLAGLGFQVHRVFTAASADNIPFRTALGFATGALVAGAVLFAFRYLGPAPRQVARQSFAWTARIFMFAATVYLAVVVTYNTAALMPYTRIFPDALTLYVLFLALSVIVFLVLKVTIRSSFAGASIAVFLLCVTALLYWTETLPGLAWLAAYDLYLFLLGRFIAGGLSRCLRFPFDSALQKSIVSFVFGILGNYLLWYGFGRLGLLYPQTVFALVVPVLIGGLIRYHRGLLSGVRGLLADAHRLFRDQPDPTAAGLLNVTLFCLLMLVLVLTVAYPGSSDSSDRMYCATIYKFAELHRIVLPPFFQHWPLLFQPMLLEMTGLPLYLAGGITPLRFFHGSVYFAFVPVVVLFCRRYNLPFRTVVILVLLVVSSSSSLQGAYTDKPEALAFPAFLSLLAMCLVVLQKSRPWDVILVGALAAVVYTTKPVLMIGVVICIVLVVSGRALAGRGDGRSGIGKAVVVATCVFLVTSSVHTVQNIVLRGNPIHPFAADIFTASRDYPEEARFAEIPDFFYRETMPIVAPEGVSMIDLDQSGGMYGPLLGWKDMAPPQWDIKQKRPRWGVAKKSISAVAILMLLLSPILLVIRADRVTTFLVVLTAASFFIWFGWIGDSLRYSTLLPSLVLLAAVVVSRPFLANRYLDLLWRYAVYALLIGSIPLGLQFTFNDQYHVFDVRYQPASLLSVPGPVKYLQHRTEPKRLQNPVTAWLKHQPGAAPILLVDDVQIGQFGLYQPNFLFKPLHWRHDLITPMVYLAEIRPTHLLTTGKLQKSSLITKYPFLATDLELAIQFRLGQKTWRIYKFREDTPWSKYGAQAREKEEANPGHIAAIRRTLRRSRSP